MHGIYGTHVEVERKNTAVEGVQLKVPPEKVSSLPVSRASCWWFVQGLWM